MFSYVGVYVCVVCMHVSACCEYVCLSVATSFLLTVYLHEVTKSLALYCMYRSKTALGST